MKHIYIILLALLARIQTTNGQIISTVAGNGSAEYSGNGGAATSAGIGFTGSIEFDKLGNLYILDLNHSVRKVSLLTGIIATFAGNGTGGYSGDNGPATAASLNFPTGIAINKSNDVYIADQTNNRIRKIDFLSAVISTVAGTGISGYFGDGSVATNAKLSAPGAVTFDSSGNLYILDGFNYRIRKVNTLGIISTVAGTGIAGYTGDDCPATNAQISIGGGMRVGKDNMLYFADGIRIRKINLQTGIITTIAGNGISGYSGDGGPATAAQFYNTMDVVQDDNGEIFISDRTAHVIRMISSTGVISTAVGTGASGFAGDAGDPKTALLYSPRGIALDDCDNLYIADNGNKRIRKVTFNPPPCTSLYVSEAISIKTTIYPNPTKETLHIDNLQTPATYRLLNMVGVIVQQGSLKKGSNSLAIEQLPAGVYMLEVYGEDGERNVSRVIKE